MTKLIQKKEFVKGALFFLLPLLPYVHIFVEGNVLSGVEFFGYSYEHNYPDDKTFFHGILTQGVWLFLIFTIWKRQNLAFRTILLFPIYMVLWRFLEIFKTKNYFFDTSDFKFLAIALILCWLIPNYLKHRANIQKSFKQFFNSKRNIVIAVVLISMPFFRSLFKYIPKGTTTLDFYFFKFGSYGFNDALVAFYNLTEKLCYLIPILIFYLKMKQWIKYAYLSAIILYLNQIINMFDSSSKVIDEIELAQSAPVLILLAVILIALAQMVEQQNRIKGFLETKYAQLEVSIKDRFQERQRHIQDKRNQLQGALGDIRKLEKLKTDLENELKRN